MISVIQESRSEAKGLSACLEGTVSSGIAIDNFSQKLLTVSGYSCVSEGQVV